MCKNIGKRFVYFNRVDFNVKPLKTRDGKKVNFSKDFFTMNSVVSQAVFSKIPQTKVGISNMSWILGKMSNMHRKYV